MNEIVTSPHFGFILAAYAVTVVVVLGMIGAILLDHRALRRALDKLGPRGSATGDEQ
jgi:heme exporter protein CcmD